MSAEMAKGPLPLWTQLCSERSNQKAFPGDLWIPDAQGITGHLNAETS